MLNENDLIKTGQDHNALERILWIDEKNDIIFTIDIFSKYAFPVMKKLSELTEKIDAGTVPKVTRDPWNRVEKDDKIAAKRKEIRNKAYEIVTSIADSEHEGDIYYRDTRGKLVKQAMDNYGVSKVMVYKYLRRYWQRGKNKNALLPDYDNSGGRGKPKTAGVTKRGRPRQNESGTGQGININEDIKQIFKAAVDKYFQINNSLKEVYNHLIQDYYVSGYRHEDLPTYTQFKYWCHKERFVEDTVQLKSHKDNNFDFFILQGFEAKIQNKPELAVAKFLAALELGPPPDLEYLLILDIFTILKETGQYQRAHEILTQFEKRSSSILPESIIGEVRANLKYLEILQETLAKAGTPNLPFSQVPSLIKVSVDQRMARWKHPMDQALP